MTKTSLFTIQPYPVGCQVSTDLLCKTSPLLRTLCSCCCPASFTCLTQPAKASVSQGLSFLQSDSPLVWSSCHHQKCNFAKLLLCLKSFIDLLIPSGYESFPKIHDLSYLGPPVIFWFLELIIPFQVFVFISAIPPFFPLTPQSLELKHSLSCLLHPQVPLLDSK